MTESPFDGMTKRKAIQMLGRVMNAKRYETSVKSRMNAVDLVDSVIDDDSMHIVNRLKAVELQLKMEAMNQVDERLAVMSGIEEKEEARVILILPPNGSEISSRKED